MDLGELKSRLQDHLSDGLVVVAGSGLSAALGMPTMGGLADMLLMAVPQCIEPDLRPQWDAIAQLLRSGTDLKTALHEIEPHDDLETHIVRATADFIYEHEKHIVHRILAGCLDPPMSALVRYLLATSHHTTIITSNYDRLIELAVEHAGYEVDTLFYRQFVSELNPRLSREVFGEAAPTVSGKYLTRRYRKHARVLKPHGSLDWYDRQGVAIRSSFSLSLPRLLVTPGRTKYAKGYSQPFDIHREAANKAIDDAARFLVVGYGFNDAHHETHLRPQLERGKPCIILTKTLSPNALALARRCRSVLALSSSSTDSGFGTLLTCYAGDVHYPDINIWDLATFISEVLQP